MNESIFAKLGKNVYDQIFDRIHDLLKEYPSATIETVGLWGSGFYGNLRKESDLDIYGIIDHHNGKINNTIKDRFTVNHYDQDREVSIILFCSNSAKNHHLRGDDLFSIIVLNDKCQLCPPSKEVIKWYQDNYDLIQHLHWIVYKIYQDYLNQSYRMEKLKYRIQLIYDLYRFRRVLLSFDPFNFEEDIDSILSSKIMDELDRRLLNQIYRNEDVISSVELFLKKKIR